MSLDEVEKISVSRPYQKALFSAKYRHSED
jgi:hypothetical protein